MHTVMHDKASDIPRPFMSTISCAFSKCEKYLSYHNTRGQFYKLAALVNAPLHLPCI